MGKWEELKDFFAKNKINSQESITIKICDMVLEKMEELEEKEGDV